MNVLITGASGFLGKEIVTDLLKKGHQVRAMVRPGTKITDLPWHNDVDFFYADLQSPQDLSAAFSNINTLIHLAAKMTGDDESCFDATVRGTERLLDAMKHSQTRRIVLASSYSVYDYDRLQNKLNEESATIDTNANSSARDGYAITKALQEELTLKYSKENGWDLIIIRPGFIWGGKNLWIDGMGLQIGRLQLIIGPYNILPLTHVSNCANCFVSLAENQTIRNEVFNLTDGFNVTSWQHAKNISKILRNNPIRYVIPYWLGNVMGLSVYSICQVLGGRHKKLPGLLIPSRYKARFKAIVSSPKKLKSIADWNAPLSYEQALQQICNDE